MLERGQLDARVIDAYFSCDLNRALEARSSRNLRLRPRNQRWNQGLISPVRP